MAAKEPRLSISFKGSLPIAELEARHQETLASISSKLAGFEGRAVLTPEQEEVQLGLELAHGTGSLLGYGLQYAIVDGTSPYGCSSLVLTNGTGLYASCDIKYLPDYRDDRRSRSVRAKKLTKVGEAACKHAARLKEELGRGCLVWAAVYSNTGGLAWVRKEALPSDLDEVELESLIPAVHAKKATAAAATRMKMEESSPAALAAPHVGSAGAGASDGGAAAAWMGLMAAVAVVCVGLVKVFGRH